jgi:hypothetical protein
MQQVDGTFFGDHQKDNGNLDKKVLLKVGLTSFGPSKAQIKVVLT